MKGKQIMPLNAQQRQLVEQYEPVVSKVIHRHFFTNEQITGLSYDDLRSEGSLALCRAAATYQEGRVVFETYASAVIKNALTDYCRQQCRQPKQFQFSGMEETEWEDNSQEDELAHLETVLALDSMKPRLSRAMARNIEALELSCSGYGHQEIAVQYGVKTNQIRVWLQRARHKLQEEQLLAG